MDDDVESNLTPPNTSTFCFFCCKICVLPGCWFCSCAPNLINYEVLVESMDCQLAHIGFFANRDVWVSYVGF